MSSDLTRRLPNMNPPVSLLKWPATAVTLALLLCSATHLDARVPAARDASAGDGMAAVAGTPLVLQAPSVRDGRLRLEWTGGRGPFVVQGKADLTTSAWEDLLTTGDRSAEVDVSGRTTFLRVTGADGATSASGDRSFTRSGDALAPSNRTSDAGFQQGGPAAASGGGPSPAAVSVLNGTGFTGLSFNDSGGYVPPDTCGAAGPTYYVETVNQALAIYRKSDGVRMAYDTFSHFLFTTGGLTRADSGSGLSDPVVVYDELIGRFVIGNQDVNFSSHVSAFDLAVSKTSNPSTLTTSDWYFYKIDTTQAGYDADYPGNMGYNADAVVVTLNMFGVTSGGHLKIVAVKASDLAAGVASPAVFQNDLADFSVRPTTMHGSVSGDPMWLVTEHGDNSSIDVIKMTGVLGNSPVFTYKNLPVSAYSGTVYPRNPNGTLITSNIDSRIQKSASANNTLVAAHAVAVSSTQDVIQWYAVDLSGTTPSLAQQGRVTAGNNTYSAYPGIDINGAGEIGMSFMQAGNDTTTDYMSMWVTGRIPTDPLNTMQAPVKVSKASGVGNYDDFTTYGRAGDLSGINVDPVDGSFWAANEFANAQATANWGTGIANFRPAAPANPADISVTATGPSSVTAGSTATYTITVANNGPSPASGIVLNDTLPIGSTLVSVTQTAGTDAFTFAQSGGTFTESATGTIASGSSDTFSLVVTASASLATGANFSNVSSVTANSSTSDTYTANNTATVSGSIVGAPAELAVTNTSGVATANEGDTITYTVTVKNNGPGTGTSVVLTDTLGSNLAYVSATTTQGTISRSGSVVTFTLGSVAVGSTVTMKVNAKATEEGTLSNAASVTATSADGTPANNSATATTTVNEPPIVVAGSPKVVTSKRNSNITVATFTHANGVEPASAFTATINWGDGQTSTGTITLSGTTYTVKGSHTYASNGTRSVTTTVTELSQAAQLLMEKIGDEDPELPEFKKPKHRRHLPAERHPKAADAL